MSLEIKELANGDEKGVTKINDNFDQVKQKFAEADTKNTTQKINWTKDPGYTGKVTYFEAYRRGNIVSIDAEVEIPKKGQWMNAIQGLPKPPRDTATQAVFCKDGGTLATFSVQSGGILSLYGNSGSTMTFPNTLVFHMTYLTTE